MEGCGGACKFKQTIRGGRIVCLREMLTDETGKKGSEKPERHWIHFVYFQVKCLDYFASVVAKLCLWHGTMSFVSCLREKTVITKKGYQHLKDAGETKDMAASYSKFGFAIERHTNPSWKTSCIQIQFVSMWSQVSNYASGLVLVAVKWLTKCRKHGSIPTSSWWKWQQKDNKRGRQ